MSCFLGKKYVFIIHTYLCTLLLYTHDYLSWWICLQMLIYQKLQFYPQILSYTINQLRYCTKANVKRNLFTFIYFMYNTLCTYWNWSILNFPLKICIDRWNSSFIWHLNEENLWRIIRIQKDFISKPKLWDSISCLCLLVARQPLRAAINITNGRF